MFSRTLRQLLSAALIVAVASLATAQQYFYTAMNGSNVVPPTISSGSGNVRVTLNTTTRTIYYQLDLANLSSPQTDGHFRGPAMPGFNGPIQFHIPIGSPITGTLVLTPTQMSNLQAGLWYFEIETMNYPSGEIRGQFTLTSPPAFVKFCFGDGSGTACPCGNASLPADQAGCLNSFGTPGRLAATGFASVALDSLVLSGTGMPNASALYFQGTTRVNGGAGSVFGDGLRCSGGTVIRLGTKTNAGGASQYPVGVDPRISVRGVVPVGGAVTRTYQVWYRNVASFCQTDGFNVSNGVEVVWIP